MRALVGALRVEAALLAIAALAVVVDLIARGGPHDGREIGMGAFLAACALGVGWALWSAARALRAGRRSGRAVAMTWQIFQVVVGVSAMGAGSAGAVALGVVLIALAVGVGVLLLLPRVVEATTSR
ncbi:hypothetical protein EV386_0141 [Xylanimonas ulmi]|uniref:Uncharacterized protein n=1 Tax=Xylanimonas ulmi TaxID=228973 RepID=A0A4Q7LYJ3_9MICO|nr:hypothetical protein EV386_0141 [Xylanibacterium ulmi]